MNNSILRGIMSGKISSIAGPSNIPDLPFQEEVMADEPDPKDKPYKVKSKFDEEEEDDLEELMNQIIEKKPSEKKVRESFRKMINVLEQEEDPIFN